MTKISVLKIVGSTAVDGPGLRTSVYCAGCSNACPGCHNPQSWDIARGTMMEVDDILERIAQEDFCDVTFTGGDPMFQALAFAELAHKVKRKTGKDIWCYTGYTFEQCLAHGDRRRLLEAVDTLVDGRFVLALKDTSLLFRGSSNQRIIDVRASLEKGEAVVRHLEDDLLPIF